MVKPMKHRDVAKLRRDAGFRMQQGRGDHEKWIAPDGHHVIITSTISPALVRQALKAIERAQENQ